MKTYIFDTISRYKRFSENLDLKALLCNKSWLVFNEEDKKSLYIFQENGELYITTNGVGVKASWKYVAANKSIIISENNNVLMFHPSFADEMILALTLENTNNCAFLINQSWEAVFSPQRLSDIQDYFAGKEKKNTSPPSIEPHHSQPNKQNTIPSPPKIDSEEVKEGRKLYDKLTDDYDYNVWSWIKVLLVVILVVLSGAAFIGGSYVYSIIDSTNLFVQLFVGVMLGLLYILISSEVIDALFELHEWLDLWIEKREDAKKQQRINQKIKQWIVEHPGDPRNKYLLKRIS